MSAQMTKLIAAEMESFFNAVREKFSGAEELEDQAEEFNKLLQQHAKECAKKIEKKNQPKVKGKLTLYQIFCKKNRDTSLPFVEQNRALSDKWSEMSEEDKQEFADEVKEELEKDAERFEKECEEKGVQKKGKKKGPKRPLGSYMLFCKHIRETDESLKELDTKEQARKMGEMWKNLSEDEQNEYKEKAKKALDKFKKENGLSSGDESEKEEKKKGKKKTEKSDSDPEKPEEKKKGKKTEKSDSEPEKPQEEKKEEKKKGKKKTEKSDSEPEEKPQEEKKEKKGKKSKKSDN